MFLTRRVVHVRRRRRRRELTRSDDELTITLIRRQIERESFTSVSRRSPRYSRRSANEAIRRIRVLTLSE